MSTRDTDWNGEEPQEQAGSFEEQAKNILERFEAQEHEKHDDSISYDAWIAKWGSFDPLAALTALHNQEMEAVLETIFKPGEMIAYKTDGERDLLLMINKRVTAALEQVRSKL